ncbi:MAG: type III-A CRISPR-associated protein Csm2 [Candidatus Dadabacteria bacterium]|nr:MAG: type III-A CRISPR-associated protein Csm2 [Candidatus Dadabacteria bacterium]
MPERRENRNQTQRAALPDIKFYINPEEKTIDPELYCGKAQEIAGALSDRSKNKSSQIRKYYDELVALEDRLRVSDEPERDWAVIKPLVKMTVAKVAYAQARELVTPNFVKFVKSGVDQINDHQDLSVFTTLFEAVIAFKKLEEEQNKNRRVSEQRR